MRFSAYLAFALSLIFVLLPLNASWSAGDKQAFVIENSGSPDGKKDIILIDENSEDVGGAVGTAKIRNLKSGRVLGSFEWSGFGVRATTDAFKVLWRPDSQCFAINWEQSRGFVGCAVYAQSSKGWRQVTLPNFHERAVTMVQAVGAVRAIHDVLSGKGHETVETWLPDHCLRVLAAYRDIEKIDNIGGDSEQYFWFILQIVASRVNTTPKAFVKSIQFAPASAYQ